MAEKKELSLQEQLQAKRVEIKDLRRSHAAGELANPRAITKARKDIARLETALSAARLAEQKESN
ncbi:50S ribosomal protein L29 [Candidatus Saccharibacteria bacterium]|nr:50S ribosomal protein L29 [Candidatus Saccharibacteria bacterium]